MAATTLSMAWVVGVGPSAGLGAALARRFAQAGMQVFITGRNEARLNSVAAQINEAGGKSIALAGDVSDPREVDRLTTIVHSAGKLRAAMFNVGNSFRGNVVDLTPEQFETVWRSSAFAGFLFMRATIPMLLESGGGSLLITGATASLRGGARFTAFAAAKASLRSVAQSAAREYGPQGVHVAHVIVDGGIDGDRLRGLAPERVAAAGDDGLLDPDAIADNYWHLHEQPRSAWTHELDLRPFKETF